MSIGIAIVTQDGVVLAADSRGTFGDPRGQTAINDEMQKVFRVTSRCGVVIAGAGEIAVTILTETQAELAKQERPAGMEASTADVAATLSRVALGFWGRHGFFTVPMEQRPGLFFLVGGVDDGGSPLIHLVPSPQHFALHTMGTGYAVIGLGLLGQYWLSRTYVADMSVGDASDLAEFVIGEAATQEGKIGGSVSLAQVTPASGWSMMDPKDLTQLARVNKDILADIRGSLVRRSVM